MTTGREEGDGLIREDAGERGDEAVGMASELSQN